MAPDVQESTLVRELTDKLEQLRAEKNQLEAVIESSMSDDLREQLLELQRRQQQQPLSRRARSESFTLGSATSSTSSSSGTGTTSFPSSPVITSPTLSQLGDTQPSFAALQHENSELRAALEASELARSRATRDVHELKRRLGMISLDELEELDLAPTATAKSPPTVTRVISAPTSRATTGSSSSIRIPGAAASSFSPPSSFMNNRGASAGYRMSTSFNNNVNNAANSLHSGWLGPSSLSSVNTALTTPSSSYPQNAPPPTSPASSTSYNSLGFPSNAFSGNGTRAPPPSVASSSSYRSPTSIMSRLEVSDVRRRRSSLENAQRQQQQQANGPTGPALLDADDDDEEEGTRTPLSTSPGSRSGSLSRRTSLSVPSASAKLSSRNSWIEEEFVEEELNGHS
ncbi:hypothetical protein OIV83_004920 [Microbotryomycetes sp. JL201]|nr:hypothetical protein OIV83_004920 [Microbotryomycetes sp. JL201]